MAITYIHSITNHCEHKIIFSNSEASRDDREIEPGQHVDFPDSLKPRIPWAFKNAELKAHHLKLNTDDGKIRWHIWQHKKGNDDRIRASSKDLGHINIDDTPIRGQSGAGGNKGLTINADGTIHICNWSDIVLPENDKIEPVGQLAKNQIAQYQTSQDGCGLARSLIEFDQQPNKGWQYIELDKNKTYQSILGFGGAFTDAAAINIKKMTPEIQEKILNAYFGPHGIGYSVGRVPMASCDFSEEFYSYAETENDFELKHFKLSSYDTDYKIPLIKKAQKLLHKNNQALTLFSSVWTAPPWLKDNKKWVGGKLKGKEGDQYHQTWAKYFSKFFDAYKKQGVEFWGVTVENEPHGFASWESMEYSPEEQRDFIKYDLGPELRRTHPEIKIMIHDDQKNHLPEDAIIMLGDPEAAQYISGIAFHWYQKAQIVTWCQEYDRLGHPTTSYPWCENALNKTREWLIKQGLEDKFMLASEACEGFSFFTSRGPARDNGTKWYRAEQYGHDIIADLNNWSVGWMDWNLALDMNGGPNHAKNMTDALILCDTENKDICHKQPMYYYLGHFSKFITPGSVRIKAESKTSAGVPMECTAFKTQDNHIVVVVQNADIYGHEYRIHDPDKGYINQYIPAHAIQTFVYPG